MVRSLFSRWRRWQDADDCGWDRWAINTILTMLVSLCNTGSLSGPGPGQPHPGCPHLEEGGGFEDWCEGWGRRMAEECCAGQRLSHLSFCCSNVGEENFSNLLPHQTAAGGGVPGCSEDASESSHWFQWWQWWWQWLNPVRPEALNPPLQSHVALLLSPGTLSLSLLWGRWLDGCEQSCQATGLS